MELGLSSYAYTWAIGVGRCRPARPLSVWDLLDRTARFGLRRLQLADNMPVHALSKADWESLIETAADKQIQLELGARGLRPAHLQRYLDLAVQCRSPFLRFVIDETGFEPDIPQIIDIIRDFLPAFRENGIVLAIENHDRFLVRQLAGIIEATDPKWVGICLDTANSLGAGEGIVEATRVLAPYTVNLHIKDFRIRRVDHQMGFTVTGCPAGKGQTPLPWLLQELARTGRCQSATLEMWTPPRERLEETIELEAAWVVESLERLRGWIYC